MRIEFAKDSCLNEKTLPLWQKYVLYGRKLFLCSSFLLLGLWMNFSFGRLSWTGYLLDSFSCAYLLKNLFFVRTCWGIFPLLLCTFWMNEFLANEKFPKYFLGYHILCPCIMDMTFFIEKCVLVGKKPIIWPLTSSICSGVHQHVRVLGHMLLEHV